MARTMSPEEYQELGRRYYRHKQYDQAIRAFTNGIEASNSPTLNLYDYRAASYDKLANFNSALKDGREMIRLNKKDVKGYLRTGSVLQKMNKLDTAIGIYKYGMKNVPVDNKDWKFLQQLHDKVNRQLSPAKAVDPFTVLPVELVEMVIGYLTFRNMVNSLRVSKGWKNYLTKCPNLWTDLNLSGARKDVSRIFVRNAIIYSGNRINRATIHRFRHPDVLRNIATACKNLTSVEFLSGSLMSDTIIEMSQCAFNLRKLILHTDVTLDTVGQILRFRPTLEHAMFTSILAGNTVTEWRGPFPNLRVLTLNKKPEQQTRQNFDSLTPLFEQAPALQSITLQDWKYGRPLFTGFSSLPLTHLTIHRLLMGPAELLPNFPPTLEHLSLQTVYPLYLPYNPVLQTNMSPWQVAFWHFAQVTRLPKLTHLTLENAQNLNPAFICALLDIKLNENEDAVPEERVAMEPLKHLSLAGCTVAPEVESIFGEGGLLTVSSRILTIYLTSLDLSTLPVTDDDIESFYDYPTTPRLETLNLTSTRVTGAGVKILVDNIPTLTTLTLDYCTGISSRDIVRYAESKGIKVSMKMEEVRGGAKRVRYG